jgi:acyl carrier protein
MTPSRLSRPEIEARVKAAVRKATDRPVAVDPADTLFDSLGLDSMRMIALTLALEDEFDRPFPLKEWYSVARGGPVTVASLCDYLERSSRRA